MQLTEVFGAGAAFSGSTLTIDIAGLASIHGYDGDTTTLTPAQMVSVLVKQWEATTGDKEFDPTYGVTCVPGFQSIVDRDGTSQVSFSNTVSVYVPNTQTTFDPDDVV
jgi:hypothetical protein